MSYFFPTYDKYYNGTVYTFDDFGNKRYRTYYRGSNFFKYGREYYGRRGYKLPDEVIFGLAQAELGKHDNEFVFYSPYFDGGDHDSRTTNFKHNKKTKYGIKMFTVEDAVNFFNHYKLGKMFKKVYFNPFSFYGTIEDYNVAHRSAYQDYLNPNVRTAYGRMYFPYYLKHKKNVVTAELSDYGLQGMMDFAAYMANNEIDKLSPRTAGSLIIYRDNNKYKPEVSGKYTFVNDSGFRLDKFTEPFVKLSAKFLSDYIAQRAGYRIKIHNLPKFDEVKAIDAAKHLGNESEENGQGFQSKNLKPKGVDSTGSKLFFSPITSAKNSLWFFRSPLYREFLKNKNL